MALPVWRRQIRQGLLIGVVFAAVVGAGFGITALTSGEFNYQGGVRKTFYGHYPFEDGQANFDVLGTGMTTDALPADAGRSSFLGQLGRNTVYFFAGRSLRVDPVLHAGHRHPWMGALAPADAGRLASAHRCHAGGDGGRTAGVAAEHLVGWRRTSRQPVLSELLPGAVFPVARRPLRATRDHHVGGGRAVHGADPGRPVRGGQTHLAARGAGAVPSCCPSS